MFSIILFEPEIPPNTGNIIRLAANTGSDLHLVGSLGFELDEPRLRRAGLDYREFAAVTTHPTLPDCLEVLQSPRVFAVSTRGTTCYTDVAYRAGDAFLFGPESRGLPPAILDACPDSRCVRIPMQPASRSLNLANAAAVLVYEAWRQNGFGACH